uniref:Ribosomal protein L32 n=1 Tax=Panagrolaimus davidi TaxID=227884 RepID=A0A914P2L2_9BILA
MPSKKIVKKVAPTPAALKKLEKPSGPTKNPLFEKRHRNFGIGKYIFNFYAFRFSANRSGYLTNFVQKNRKAYRHSTLHSVFT